MASKKKNKNALRERNWEFHNVTAVCVKCNCCTLEGVSDKGKTQHADAYNTKIKYAVKMPVVMPLK